jgi:hypothetical protein
VDVLRLPFFDEMAEARRVLVAGAGGGFDVFSGLPLYFALRDAGKEAHLASLTFASLGHASGRRLAPNLVEVTADSGGAGYFPERHLAQWFRQVGREVPVYCLARGGPAPLRAAYRTLVERLGLDTIVLVDGGTDSLMRGDEAKLGSPEEDAASIAVVADLDVARRLLVCLGFGIEGVCDVHVLEAVAELTRLGGFLGTFSLTADMAEVLLYREAVRAVLAAAPGHASVVCGSVLLALEEQCGDYRPRETSSGTVWVNPLMTLYWCFRLEAVARRLLLLDAVRDTTTFDEVDRAINHFRAGCAAIRPRASLPERRGVGR